MSPPDDRPKWSITWLFRVQRLGRDRQERAAEGTPSGFTRWFPWAVLLLLLIEVGLLVWLGILPR